ncbi:Beta-lactamase [Alloactinosynnema sp. L-07]|uniref:serine hydrolase domain-containing protein n=1 Tax=Alloactinosynnema sp. L-07 TaxID=1653480 RepID=UPI00065EF84A|nr:serine hydrolase domain-containing protein [Alloactinosynnema sp. L-07]CRK56563.1 Beta-lactamase [Alloactinosynnema sp. L-07]
MTDVHGDATLAESVREFAGDRHRPFAVAAVSPRGTRVASVGADSAADFEIGSISKGITGLLYVDALARGEIAESTKLGELLPLADTPAGGVTLASISTHHSGLPRLPKSAAPLRRTIALWRHGTNPYGDSLDELIAQARTVKLGKPRGRYSNLGYQLLGHAIARAAGLTYQDLVRLRIAEPLRLDTCSVPASPDQLRPDALVGKNKKGREQQPWTGEALGPAGGIRASIGDMARLTAALLDGSAPGMAALDPVSGFAGPARIGAAWLTFGRGERSVTWHNGGTGGFSSWLGLDRPAGTGVVILSATSASVDRAGFALLKRLTGDEGC